jgi:DNA replication protein DnaC
MNAYPELTGLCAKLNLRGLVDTFSERHRQALERSLSHTEFLMLLLQDELGRRQQKRLATRLKQALLRHEKTIESFDASVLQGQRPLLHELATARFVREAAPVLIVGNAGTGKTHLAHAIGHQALRQGFEVLALSQAQLETRLGQARAQGTRAKFIRAASKVDLLIIDDLGLKPLRAPSDEDLHEIIDERYERKATLVTSNLDVSEWPQAFPSNQLIAVATIDRLRHRAYQLTLEGETRRVPRPLGVAADAPPKSPKTGPKATEKAA